MEIWLLDTATCKATVIDKAVVDDDDYDASWSPDSKWLAYTQTVSNRFHAMFLYSVASGKSTQITDAMSDVRFPAFDRGGKYLYFTESTNYGTSTSGLDMSSDEFDVTRSVYALVLAADTPSPIAPQSEDEKTPEARDKDKEKDKDKDDKDKDKDKDKDAKDKKDSGDEHTRHQRDQRCERGGGCDAGRLDQRVAANSQFNVTVTDNGVTNTYVAAVNGAGTSWSATIPSSAAKQLADGTATIAGQVSDGNGKHVELQPERDGCRNRPCGDAECGRRHQRDQRCERGGGVTLGGSISGVAANSQLQRDGHRQWCDQDLCGDGERRRHQLERDDPVDGRHAAGRRHGDDRGPGERWQRQYGELQPERDGCRNRACGDA